VYFLNKLDVKIEFCFKIGGSRPLNRLTQAYWRQCFQLFLYNMHNFVVNSDQGQSGRVISPGYAEDQETAALQHEDPNAISENLQVFIVIRYYSRFSAFILIVTVNSLLSFELLQHIYCILIVNLLTGIVSLVMSP